jgi:translation initiation factor IF-3
MHLRHRRRPKPKPELIRLARFNGFITVPEVRVIGPGDKNLGIMPTADAIRLAQQAESDLVEINPKGQPPVCKIINQGQFRYEQEKEARKAKARQKVVDIKGVRLSLRIKGADLEMRQKQATRFMEEGDKVKVEMVLRGRERAHMDLAEKIMRDFAASVPGATMVQPLSKQGGRLNLILGRK